MIFSNLEINLIAAVAQNRGIGLENSLLWHLPEDMKFFRETTTNHSVLMGRKTFDSIGKPLPKRQNIVLTHQKNWTHTGVTTVHSLDDALTQVLHPKLFVIGGAEIYRLALPIAHRLILTEVDDAPKADAFFPDFSHEHFREISRTQQRSEHTPNLTFSFVIYERV